jgi:hypothetical protein
MREALAGRRRLTGSVDSWRESTPRIDTMAGFPPKQTPRPGVATPSGAHS